MARLKAHQRPIVTRWAHVQPFRYLGDGDKKTTVPCEPEDAVGFVVVEWHPVHGYQTTTMPIFWGTGRKAMKAAQDAAHVRHLELASYWEKVVREQRA